MLFSELNNSKYFECFQNHALELSMHDIVQLTEIGLDFPNDLEPNRILLD